MKTPLAVALVASISLVTACGSTSQKVGDYVLTNDASGLVPDNSIAPAWLYVRPNAPALSTYDQFIVDPVTVRYDDPSIQRLDPDDVSRMQNYFRDEVSNELRAAGKTIANEPGENTMRISFTLSGIAAPSAVPNAAGALVGVAIAVGTVTIEAAFADSETGRVDAVVVDRSRGARALNATPWSTWRDIESTFDYWADGIADAVKS